MKKTALLSIILLLCVALVSCGAPKADDPKQSDDEEIVISKEELIENAESSVSLWEFFQSILRDQIIYKNRDGSFEYESINKKLPLNDYDFANLSDADAETKEKSYVKDGTVLSIKGIDVSKWQGKIDWEKVRADGVEFAIIRLGYRGYSTGLIAKDERFDEYISGASDAGVKVGIYFVTQATTEAEAIEEADYIIDAVSGYDVTWPICLDLEDAADPQARTANLTKAERTELIKAFCDRIKSAGYTPSLYANINWFMREMDLSELTDYDKWFAQYFSRPYFPYEFQMWQYTNQGKVDGINGNVDLDICMVDYSIKK